MPSSHPQYPPLLVSAPTSPLPWGEQEAPRQGKVSDPPVPLPPAAVQGPLGEGKPDISPLSKALAEPMMHI